jgi:hypothetical protein
MQYFILRIIPTRGLGEIRAFLNPLKNTGYFLRGNYCEPFTGTFLWGSHLY